VSPRDTCIHRWAFLAAMTLCSITLGSKNGETIFEESNTFTVDRSVLLLCGACCKPMVKHTFTPILRL